MAEDTTSKCSKCACKLGIAAGVMCFDDKCPKCSGRRVKKCLNPTKCGVLQVDIGIGKCPFCNWPRLRDA